MTIPTITDRIAEATRYLSYIMVPGAIRELRADTKAGFISGRYTDPAKMALHGVRLQEKHGLNAVYYGLNAAKPDAKFGASELNTMQRRPSKGGAAKDADIAHRSLYAIDIDSVREKGTMASDDQHLETVALAHRVISLIRSRVPEFPDPIWIHSGNGTHLVWRGDHCAADSPVWKYTLRRIAAEVCSPGAAVDTTVFNPSRILRLPGSINRKGPDTPDAPHRMVKVTRYPTTWTQVEHGPHIYGLATALGYSSEVEQREKPGAGIEGTESMVMDLIHEYPEMLSFAGSSDGGEKTTVVIEECPFVGRRHEHGNSAFLVYADGAVRYKCFAESCPGQGFGSLLRLLRERTGRTSAAFPPPDGPITPREIEIMERWSMEEAPLCTADTADTAPIAETAAPTANPQPEEITTMDHTVTAEPVTTPTNLLSPAETEYVEALLAQDPRSIPEAIKAVDWTHCSLPPNPAAWGLTLDDVWETYRRRVVRDMGHISDPIEREEFRMRHMRVMDTADFHAIGKTLGYYWLATICTNKKTRPSMDPHHVLTANEMQAYLAA